MSATRIFRVRQRPRRVIHVAPASHHLRYLSSCAPQPDINTRRRLSVETMEKTTTDRPSATYPNVGRAPWNKGKLIGAKPPLRPKHVWAIRTKLQLERDYRDLCRFLGRWHVVYIAMRCCAVLHTATQVALPTFIRRGRRASRCACVPTAPPTERRAIGTRARLGISKGSRDRRRTRNTLPGSVLRGVVRAGSR